MVYESLWHGVYRIMPGLHQKLGHLGGLAAASVAWSKLPTENPPCFFGGKPHWKSMKTQGFSHCSMYEMWILMENGGAYPAGNLRKNPICQPVILMHFHGFSWASMENGGTLLMNPSARPVLVHHFMTWVPNIEGIDTISISPFQDAEIKLTPMLHR